MMMTVEPSYGRCTGKEETVFITINPAPISNIVFWEGNCLEVRDDGFGNPFGLQTYRANNGRPMNISTYNWEIEHDPPVDLATAPDINLNGLHVTELIYPAPDAMEIYRGTLYMTETNTLTGCSGERVSIDVVAIPAPVVRAAPEADVPDLDLGIEMCFGNWKLMDGDVLNKHIYTPTELNNLVWTWSLYNVPLLDRNGLPNIDNNPDIQGRNSGWIQLTVTDLNGCESEPSRLYINVLRAPEPPMVPRVTVCQFDDEFNPAMTMTVQNAAANELFYWERLPYTPQGGSTQPSSNLGSTTSTLVGAQWISTMNMNAHLPAPLWGAGTTEQYATVPIKVYREGIVQSEIGGPDLTCESQPAETELRINRNPLPPNPATFEYCEDKQWGRYELSATGGTGVGYHWNPTKPVLEQGFGNPFWAIHPDEDETIAFDVNGMATFTHHVVSVSIANCNSTPAEINLIINKNPELKFEMHDEHGETTGGCAPFDMTAVNISTDDTVEYTWNFEFPNDAPVPAPIGPSVGVQHRYESGSIIPQQVRVRLTGVINPSSTLSCTSVLEKTLTIFPELTAAFNPTATEGCDNMHVIFNASNLSLGAYNFRWYWNLPAGDEPSYPGHPNPAFDDDVKTPDTTIPNPFHFFPNPGSTEVDYKVWLQVDNGYCYKNVSDVITVYPVPNAEFDYQWMADFGGNWVCPPEPVIFTNNSASTGAANNANTGYVWDFGDGFRATTTIADPPVRHEYQNWVTSVPVPHTVTLTASNEYTILSSAEPLICSKTSNPITILVAPRVEATIVGPVEGCSPFVAFFQSQTRGVVTAYSWDWGDGNPNGTGANPCHEYVTPTDNQPEDYVITLKASNTWCNQVVQHNFRLYPQPVADFGKVDPIAGCHPLTVTFPNNSTQNVPGATMIYNFDFFDGSAAEKIDDTNPVEHIFENYGGAFLHVYPTLTARAKWRDDLICVSKTVSQHITVNPYLKAKFEMENSEGCSPLTTLFRNTSVGYISYQYSFGDGATALGDPSLGAYTTHEYKTVNMYQDMTYQVTLSVNNGDCVDEETREVLVYSAPTADFRPSSPWPAPYMYPAPPIHLDNLVPEPDRGELTYLWSWSEQELNYLNHFSDDVNPADLRLSEWGDYNIIQRVTSPNGICSDVKMVTVEIVPPPVYAGFDDVPPACLPYSVQFSNNSRYARYYKWDFGDGYFSSDPEPQHTYHSAGTYTVTLTAVGDHIYPATVSKTITVHPLPQAGFEISPNFLWVGMPLNTQNYTTNLTTGGVPFPVWYEWDFGDGSPVDTTKNPTHMYWKAGNFNITLTVGTYTSPQCITSVTKTDAVELEKAGDIIFPNIFKPSVGGEPSDVVTNDGYKNNLFYPPVLTPTRKYNLMIFTRWGQLIYQSTDPNRGWNGYFKGNLCEEGVYMYRVEGIYETGQPFTKVGNVLLLR